MPENEITNKFRLGMRKFVYSVSVVSNLDEEKINAITVSSVTSVSLDPPSVVVSINKKSSIHASLISDSRFCINTLTTNQQDIAEICSDPKKGAERSKYFELLNEDVPLLDGALLNIICRVDKVFQYHSHSLVVGVVQDVRSIENQQSLIYQEGAYKTLPKQH